MTFSFGRLYPFSLQGFCTNGRYYNSDLSIPKFRRQFIHYCPVNSFPTNPTSIGMRVPKNPRASNESLSSTVGSLLVYQLSQTMSVSSIVFRI